MREKETAARFSPEPPLYLMLIALCDLLLTALIAINAAKKNYALLNLVLSN
jgi:hypothetical protein